MDLDLVSITTQETDRLSTLRTNGDKNMKQVYFGFAIADSMFPSLCDITKETLDLDQVKDKLAKGVVSCLNPSHTATIQAMQTRYGICVEIPPKASIVSLKPGDQVIVMSVRGLPRLGDGRSEYTQEEIDGATFAFSLYSVR